MLHPEYQMTPPKDWERPEYYQELNATDAQCYWHYTQTDQLTNKLEMREYPTYDYEAFIAGGEAFFDEDALFAAISRIIEPIRKAEYVSAL